MKEMLSCRICDHKTEKSLQAHINNKHNMINSEYRGTFPGALIYSKSYSDRLRYTNAHRDPSYKKKLSDKTRELYENSEWVESHNKALKEAQSTLKAKENHRKGALNYFKNRTKKQREYHRERLIQSWKDSEKRNNRVKALKNAHNRSEIRYKHSKATKKFINSLTTKEKEFRKINLKKVWAKPENREKILKLSKIGLKAAMSPKGRENFFLAQKNPELREKRREIAIKRLQNQPVVSSLNKYFHNVLRNNKLYPESEYRVGHYVVDFCFPDKKLIIETDGDFWHANPSIYNTYNSIQKKVVAKDKREATYCQNHGWNLLRFWERDIYQDVSMCIKQIQDELYG